MEQELLTYITQYIDINTEEAEELLRFDLVKSYPKGTILLREGEYSSKSYFVLKGCIRNYYLIDGEERTTAFYLENEPFIPACVPVQQPSSSFISCVEDSILSVSTTEMEEIFFSKFPRFENLCRVMAEKMIARNQLSFEHYRNSTPEQRYMFLLAERPDLLNRVPQYQLASFLGVKPESLSRIRKRLSKSPKGIS